jgi:hypothetical protein
VSVQDLIKKSGSDVDLSKLPEGSLEAIGTVASVVIQNEIGKIKNELVTSASSGVADAVGEKITDALKPFEERLGKVEGGKGDPKDPAPKPGEPNALEAKLAEIEKKLADAERTQAETAAQAGRRQKAEAYLDKHYPNLRDVDRAKVLDRVQAGAIEGDQNLKAAVEAHREDLSALGVKDTDKLFSAEPAKEGAEDENSNEDRSKFEANLAEVEKAAG